MLHQSKSTACKACPFRISSRLVYDDAAMKVLIEDGGDPSCHQRVGMSNIFQEYSPKENRCHGYDAWQRNENGFATPNRNKGKTE